MIVLNRDFFAVIASFLSPRAQITWCLLKHHENPQTKQCNPRASTLAAEMRVSLRTAKQAIAELKAANLIRTIRTGRSSRYEVQNPAPQKYGFCTSEVQDSALRPPPHPITERTDIEEKDRRESGNTAFPPPGSLVPQFDPNPVLEEARAIYQRAGVPLSPNEERFAADLILRLDPEVQSRVNLRLPQYLKYQIIFGPWTEPRFTKRLVNVLKSGEWDVEIVMRDLPAPRKPTVAEQQEELYFRNVAATAARNGR